MRTQLSGIEYNQVHENLHAIYVNGTGFMLNERFFMGAVFLLGLGGGLMTISNLSFMLDMTVPQAAGLYIGALGHGGFSWASDGNNF